MQGILSGATRFRCDVFPNQAEMYRKLVSDGQHPQALIISCADSRVVPELITQCGPGDLFVCRNAGNIVPPYALSNAGGVTSTIEYAVKVLGVRDIVVCGHSDCGAMKAFLKPGSTDALPAVAGWLRHACAAEAVLRDAYPDDLAPAEKAKALAQENVVVQLNHLRTHPSVAAGVASGTLTLHGWLFDLDTGTVLALDGETGRFRPMVDPAVPPVAVPPADRRAAAPFAVAAE
ncbi:carbonic anhydrase [Lichenibacterium dinghuense]|uniref:carbonic anhydrase n=1 Tax=Lichenibacterium dinghuense TaxID=2895977 RepID=UPI001F22496C|nr:carbonic anhydrase [Lichenibacterium sp. 6Y81]